MAMIVPDISAAHVRVIAPAATLPAWAHDEFSAGIEMIKGHGYHVTFADHVFEKHFYFSAPAQQRSDDFATALHSDDVDIIWAARGGYGTTGALAALTSADVALHPKWLVGYSDLTAAHVLWQKAGLTSLHAAMGKGISSWTPAARDELFSLLAEQNMLHQAFQGQVLFAGDGPTQRRGVLWGGNLTVLASLCGTPTMPPRPDEPTILFVEDNELNYRSHRAAQQLLQAGALRNVQAVLFGQWDDSFSQQKLATIEAQAERADHLSMLRELFEEQGIPVVAGLPVGHLASSRPLLFGGMANVSLDTGQVEVAAMRLLQP